MRSAQRWWRERTAAQRIDVYTRWSLLWLSATEPLLAALLLGAQQQVNAPGAAVLLVVSVLHTITCVQLLRAGLAQATGGRPPGRRLIKTATALTAAAVAVGAVAFSPYLRPLPDADQAGYPLLVDVVLLFGGAFTVALVPLLRARWLLVAVLVPAGGLALAQAATAGPGGPLAWASTYASLVGGAVLGYRISVWSLVMTWQIDRSRDVQARLAVAEERLRFARDLHDVLGRNLALIAVKSELSAQLARRGKDGAAEHMLDVRQLAQDSMREVREVVGGYRGADLDTELAGARSVLRSAGISTRVIGDGTGLSHPLQVAHGWVVREAATNIIRHSDATSARIQLDTWSDPDPAAVVLRIENDGVRLPATPSRSGTGLIGLRERLAGLGGNVTATELPGGRFLLEARLPSTREPMPAAEPAR